MAVIVSKLGRSTVSLSPRLVRKLAQVMLAHLGLVESELSLVLTNDAKIQEINYQYRNKDRPTDVLSFPQVEFRKPLVPRRGHSLSVLGDVIISLETAARQAASRKRPLECEVRFLLAHGLLHLLGYDHMEPEEKREMSKKTRELVRMAPLE